jgi:hypothetical protein
MHGRKCLVLTAALFLAACSSNSILNPDCHTCPAEAQAWEDFSWKDLSGKWKGSVETVRGDKGAKKVKKDEKVEIKFLTAKEFFEAKKIEGCGSMPAEAVVMNGIFWSASEDNSSFDAFVPAAEEKVAYGRIRLERLNGTTTCRFSKFGGDMGKNRLNLPSVMFSNTGNFSGRGLASLDEKETSVEFLRFAPMETAKKGRSPAMVQDEARPPLMIRVFQLSSQDDGYGKTRWAGSEEKIFRLWKQ